MRERTPAVSSFGRFLPEAMAAAIALLILVLAVFA